MVPNTQTHIQILKETEVAELTHSEQYRPKKKQSEGLQVWRGEEHILWEYLML